MRRGPGRRCFTLLEMIAVVAIMVLVLAVTAVSLRSDRTQASQHEAMKEFELFCAKVRGAVRSDGIERKLELEPDSGGIRVVALHGGAAPAVCRAEDLDSADAPWVVMAVIEPEDEEEREERDRQSALRRWKFPEALKLEIRTDSVPNLADGESPELWRYRRDGTAQLNQPLIVYGKDSAWSFTVSEFSGQVVRFDRDITQDDTAHENILTIYR